MKYTKEKINRPYQWLFCQIGIFILWTLLTPLVKSLMPSYLGGIVNYILYIGLTIISLKYILHFPLKNLLTTSNKIRWNNIIIFGLLWITVGVIIHLIGYFIDPSKYIKVVRTPSFESIFWPLILIIIAAFFEEFIFRGYFAFLISDELPKKNTTKLTYSLINGIVFALAHWQNPELGKTSLTQIFILFIYFALGAFLMYLMLETGGIEASFGIHLFNNLFCFLIVAYPNSVIPTYSLFEINTLYSWETPVTTIIAITVCFFVQKMITNKLNDKTQN